MQHWEQRHKNMGVLDAGYGITSPAFPEFAYRAGLPWSMPWGDLRFDPEPLAPPNTI
jgi:hypothetical protein